MEPCLATDATLYRAISVTTPPTATRRFDLRRLYTAAILIPAVYAIIMFSPPWALTLLLIVVGSIALLEFYRMAFGSPGNPLLTNLWVAAFVLVLSREPLPFLSPSLLMLSILVMTVIASLLIVPHERRWKEMGITLFGVLYVGLTLSTVVSTRSLPAGEALALFLAVVTWASDSGAYYAGTLWGKHLLMPSISPKKTVEGVFGGLAVAIAAALLAKLWFVEQLSVGDVVILGLLLTLSGLVGDLFESVIKRRTGVKDSGGILPGHGGMLDRIDSLLFTAPTFYYYVTWIRGLSPPL